MEMWRSCCSSSLHTNLKAILPSSLPLRVRKPSLVPNPSRHLKTVALFPHRCAFSSSLLRSFHLFPTKPISFKPNTIESYVGLTLRAFSSLSSNQELEWKEPSSLFLPQEEQSRVIPVKTYFLCTRSFSILSPTFLFWVLFLEFWGADFVATLDCSLQLLLLFFFPFWSSGVLIFFFFGYFG